MSTPFKMKGSPARLGTIQGATGHTSALKAKEDDINKLLEKRKKLKEKQEKLETRKKEGKKTILGDYRRKRKEKQLEKVQKKINVNPDALRWKKEAEAEAMEEAGDFPQALINKNRKNIKFLKNIKPFSRDIKQ